MTDLHSVNSKIELEERPRTSAKPENYSIHVEPTFHNLIKNPVSLIMEVKCSASLMTLTMFEAAAGDTGGICLEVSVYNQPHGLYTCIYACVHACVCVCC